jgi:hypothetical protein
VLLVCIGGDDAAAARRKGPALDPVGTWNCVIYGHPAFGDERVFMDFAASGAARMARQEEDGSGTWTGLAPWAVEDDELTFADPRSGRRFTADLRRGTLGGGWRTLTLVGGWWCGAIDAAAAPQGEVDATPRMPPLVPSLTATPSYPVQAIREAKQGKAVTCFFVDAEGHIVRPELIEISDEVFRAPILAALERSRYQGWEDQGVLRPGCRSYIFKLDALNQQ